ncbi:hypothetical protein [Variovorax sp. PMC12]|uniref:hypothetical protein n=1 Tax=Variovorax sp. PMC12 TaxID=2126319 RepID=UPI000D122F46|nr:hypothetical protein [Variovorax sp. PMC12]AVQ80766.1 hypothetical protein C4F17_07270 [Variovorax sp. PMC12]
MDHKDITEVKEINGDDNVNKFLKAGWVLLNTVAKQDGTSSWIAYSMGWPKDGPAVIPQGTSYA